MELGTNITAKLEPFMLMSKSAKGAAAAKLIQDATSAPGVFVFAELLEQPNIQEVRYMAYIGTVSHGMNWIGLLPMPSVSEQRTACATPLAIATLRLQDISGLSSLSVFTTVSRQCV